MRRIIEKMPIDEINQPLEKSESLNDNITVSTETETKGSFLHQMGLPYIVFYNDITDEERSNSPSKKNFVQSLMLNRHEELTKFNESIEFQVLLNVCGAMFTKSSLGLPVNSSKDGFTPVFATFDLGKDLRRLNLNNNLVGDFFDVSNGYKLLDFNTYREKSTSRQYVFCRALSNDWDRYGIKTGDLFMYSFGSGGYGKLKKLLKDATEEHGCYPESFTLKTVSSENDYAKFLLVKDVNTGSLKLSFNKQEDYFKSIKPIVDELQQNLDDFVCEFFQ